MKKTIAVLSVLSFAAASLSNAHAGDREWAVVGKVLTGVAAAHVVSHIVAPPPHVVYQPVYTAQPVVVQTPYAPPPQVVYVRPAPVAVCPPPVYYAPPPPPCVAPPHFAVSTPILSVSLGFGHHRHHHHRHHHRRHCR